MDFRRLEDADLDGNVALVRVDINVPFHNGQVTDNNRILAIKPTIDALREFGAKTVLLAHFGRPKGNVVPEMSLSHIIPAMEETLECDVAFASDCVGDVAKKAISKLGKGDVLLLENTRFYAGETDNDADFAKALAANGDLFVSDAFSVSHRAHASNVGIAQHLPAYAGRAMERELDHLTQALSNPKQPVIGVVGGAKVSTKIDVLNNLVKKLDILIIGGGMANGFFAANGHNIGTSLSEDGMGEIAKSVLKSAVTENCRIMLPTDVVVAKKFEAKAPSRVVEVDQVGTDEMILDAGPESVNAFASAVHSARTLIWNGPLGAFELEPFDTATMELMKYTAKRVRSGDLIAVSGGGDTVSALKQANVKDDFTFVSTAGGAFLEWMEGKTLPGVAVLQNS